VTGDGGVVPRRPVNDLEADPVLQPVRSHPERSEGSMPVRMSPSRSLPWGI